MTMTVREVLEAVAAGRMSAEEAAGRLAGGGGGVELRRVRVRAATRAVRVVGDSGVSEVAVSGLHEVRREGDTLVVAAHPAEGGGGFAFVPPDLGRLVAEGKAKVRHAAREAAREASRVAYAAGRPSWAPPPGPGRSRKDWREWMGGSDWMGRGDWAGKGEWAGKGDWTGRPGWSGWSEPLVIRVNPQLAVDVDLSAGSLEVSGVRGPVSVDVSFASATLEGLSGPIDVRAQAATVRFRGALTQGASRVRADAAAIFVFLAPESDVVVHSTCELGRLRVVRGEHAVAPGEELVLGRGRASLDIEASMGSVLVRADEAGRS
jgi:hypothetical protein